MARAKRDPWIRRSTLRHLTMGETPSVRAVALQLHMGMVQALQDGEGVIRATWKEVADWSGVSYASVKRAVIRLRELGWVRELPGHGIVFDYLRSCPAEKAQFEPRSYMELNPTGKAEVHPTTEAPSMEPGEHQATPTGGAVPDRPRTSEAQRAEREAALAILRDAGVSRAGAWPLVRGGGADLVQRVQAIVGAVQGLPVRPFKPGGLIVAALRNRRLESRLVKSKKPASVVPSAPPKLRSPWDEALELVRGWRGMVAEPDDLRFLLQRSPGITPEMVRVAAPEWAGWV